MASRIQRRRADASRRGKLGVQARRANMVLRSVTAEYAGTIRYIQPSGKVRQVVIRSSGMMVYVDGGPVKTFKAFCHAMNRKLWAIAVK